MPESKHGTQNRYLRGCRCRPCTVANSVASREYRRARRKQSYEAPRPKKPCECPDGYCAMYRMATSLKAEKAIQRMRDRAMDEGKRLVCRRSNGSTNLGE